MNLPHFIKCVFFSFLLLLLLGLFLPSQKSLADTCAQFMQTPSIFQVNRTTNQAILYIQPVDDPVTSYTIVYGFSAGDERYSSTFSSGQSTGAIPYTIGDLNGRIHYYFKIRANNDCANSNWSSWVADGTIVITTPLPTQPAATGTPKIPVAGSESIFFGLGIGVIFIIAGSLLFIL